MQLKRLHGRFDRLQLKHGHKNFKSVYGSGCTKNPNFMLIFMNPTGKNVSSDPNWSGIRAPWIGTKNIWRFFYKLGFISKESLLEILSLTPEKWSPDFSKEIYAELSRNQIFVTNLAKCTQIDSRPLSNTVFKNYLETMREEILAVKPKKIIAFGNQVSSILLGRSIKVSNYIGNKKETLRFGKARFDVFPTFYPVGQGQRNVGRAISRIKAFKTRD